jgi:SNF2 family DNA or RNA helicase
MLHRLKETVGSWEWGCCIVDESHFLTTKQSKTLDSPLVVTCLEVIRKSKRAILLSGTPSLSRPFDIFNQVISQYGDLASKRCSRTHSEFPGPYRQVDALQPGLLGASRRQFASSYCRGTKVQVLQESRGDVRTVVSCSGLTHSSELNSLLRESVMIRRLKCDVLSQLPPMRRTVIRVEPSNKDLQSALLSRKEKGLTASMSAYQQEGLKKVPRAVEWVSLLAILFVYKRSRQLSKMLCAQLVDKVGGCGSEVKFVIFAHHVMVMDALQRGFELCGEFAKLSCNPVLRIDGEVDQKSRKERLRDFHADPCSRIMLVSTTAGGQGIDISCASVRLFDRLNYVV